jgi:SRR1
MDLRNKFTKEAVSPAPAQSREEVENFFQTMRQAWEASEPCKRLRSTLVSTKTPFRISKIVGLACAPIADSRPERWAHRSAFQHALILTLHTVFDKKNKGRPDRIRCYAQDPAYTEIDESILKESGITVLDNPQAFLEVDDFTVVVSCAPNVPVKQIISDLARPAVMIWDRIGEDEPEVLT